MTTWFISDLHLDAALDGINRLLLDFLHSLEGRAAALYILGDLFEYWVGDDVLDSSCAPACQPVVAGLRRVSDSGVKLYFQHGNRDFLIGEQFAAATGCTLLAEQVIVDLYGTPTLLLHGDSLCTDDVQYQQVRRMFRNPTWQQQFLSLPVEERIRQAEAMRAQSRAAMQDRPDDILDVNPQAVLATLQAAGVTRMIHGHTHRPAIHDLRLDGQAAQRVVLGDWHEQHGSFLRVSPQGMELTDRPY